MALPEIKEEPLNISSISHEKLTWVNIERPTQREIGYLARNYPFHPLDLDDCLSRIQRPKIDPYENYLFMVFHFPVFNKQARVTTPSQVSIFLGEDYLISLHQGNLKPLMKFFRECQMNEQIREESMSRSTSYLLYLMLDRLVNYCFPILNKIGSNIEVAEDKVFSKDASGSVYELSVLRRDVISYRRLIKPQTEILELLERMDWSILKEDPEVYFGDLADHSRKIQDTLDDCREVIEGLNDTNNTLSSFRINRIIRILTIISTIMLPPTLIASIYGMNLKLPFVENPLSFFILTLIMIGLVGGMLTFFRVKRWI